MAFTKNRFEHRPDGITVLFLTRRDGTELECLIGTADFETVRGYHWSAVTGGSRTIHYAFSGTRTQLYLHRLLLPDAATVGHINHDGLDCRRCNLRAVTHTQKLMNKRKRVDSALPFKGIARLPHGQFRARIKSQGKHIHLGVFDTAEEGARAYDAAALKYFGEFACINFPSEASLAVEPIPPQSAACKSQAVGLLAMRQI